MFFDFGVMQFKASSKPGRNWECVLDVADGRRSVSDIVRVPKPVNPSVPLEPIHPLMCPEVCDCEGKLRKCSLCVIVALNCGVKSYFGVTCLHNVLLASPDLLIFIVLQFENSFLGVYHSALA